MNIDLMSNFKTLCKTHTSSHTEEELLVEIPFSEMPQHFLTLFPELVEQSDIEVGYLACECWKDSTPRHYVFELVLEFQTVNANDCYWRPEYTNILDEIADNFKQGG